MVTALKFVYSLSLSFWIGSIFFFSMFAAPSIFKILSREQAGNVVSDIFPKYYLVAYICGAIALISSLLIIHLANQSYNISNIIKLGAITVMIGLAVYAGQVNLPKAHAVRTEMRTLEEGSSEYKKIRKQFSELHKTSAILNSVIFILGIALVFLSAYTNRE